jgi:hemoglobin-like flavoprotein
MAPARQELIRSSWSALEPIADEVTTSFYARVFELDPGLRGLFSYTDMDRQREQVLQMLAVVVRYIDRLDQIMPEIDALGRRHAGYGVAPEHFATIGSALLWAFERGLGDTFTQETAFAWADAYRRLSSTMIAAAQRAATTAAQPRRRRRGSAALPLGWQMESTPT